MAESEVRHPTDAELEILNVLWERGPSTVREVHDALATGRDTRYTTTLKLMQIMAGKGIVERDQSQRAHLYRPAVARERTLNRITRDLLDRAFGGSAERLLVHALRGRKVSGKELSRIRKLLDDYEAEVP